MAYRFPIELRGFRVGKLGKKPAIVLLCAVLMAFGISAASQLIAQIEGDRGIPAVVSSKDIHVPGIKVNVRGQNAEQARKDAWQIAQRKAWAKINGPKMSDDQLDGLVASIVIESEQIGPRRYIGQLGVIFDRSRAGRLVGRADVTGGLRSSPLLVIPVLYSGGVRQVFEVRGPWQRAWANFQTSESPIDYVRPTGSGGESLILTAGQPDRRSRIWWRSVLDQFDAADVIIPVARLERQWPGGPVHGTFTARYGPDNKFLDSFTLKAADDEAIPDMLDQALVQMDGLYRDALIKGVLKPDPTLAASDKQLDSALAQLFDQLEADGAEGEDVPPTVDTAQPGVPVAAPQRVSTYAVQFVTPNAAMVDSALAAVRGVAGVRSAATSSIAIGGTSVMRVTIVGDLNALAAALRSQGWPVTVWQGALRISR